MSTELEILSQIKLLREDFDVMRAAIQDLHRQGPSSAKPFLTTHELMERWVCSYDAALAFMHRKGSGAIKPSKKLLVSLKEVERHERMMGVRTG